MPHHYKNLLFSCFFILVTTQNQLAAFLWFQIILPIILSNVQEQNAGCGVIGSLIHEYHHVCSSKLSSSLSLIGVHSMTEVCLLLKTVDEMWI